MRDIIDNTAEEYAIRYTTPTDNLLHEIEKYTYQNHPHANMLSGPLQGKLLEMISKMIKPERVLEIGTFMG